MNSYQLARLMLVVAIIVVIVAKVFTKLFFGNRKLMTTRFIARTAVFAAISIILYTVPFLKFSIPGLFPSFLEIHLDEVPALIAGFAYGPLSGFIIVLIKTIVKLPLTNTACVGELADFIYSTAFVIPAALIYKHHRNIKGAIVSLAVATGVQIVVASVVTTYVMLDMYAMFYHFPKVAILSMCQTINPNVKDLGLPFMLMVSLPFNALKDAIVIAITFVLYKRLRLLFKKIDAQKN